MLAEKIRQKKPGIILYGLTPPKATNTHEEVQQIAQRQIDRLIGCAIDGLVLYDLQDEAERTLEERPFPFMETISPTLYKEKYLQPLGCPMVVYRAVGKYKEEETQEWLKAHEERDFMTVFVGAASRKQATTIDIKTAYALKRKLSPGMLLGGIAIPERHTKKSDEHKRMLEKIEHGCCFFITQAVYDLEASKQLLDDYVAESSKRNTPLVPVIFTLTPCGSAKTLAFMKWLGIHVPRALEEMLLASGDMLGGSMAYLRYVAKMLYMYGASKGVSVGFNIESVAIRREEIEASIALVEEVGAIIFNKP